MNDKRKIIHIDMDCFYAAVERLDNPSLCGLPLAVGHDSERSVVSTASYEARRFGVHSAQSIQTAKRLCPALVIVEPRHERYKEVSGQIHAIFHRYTDIIEPISLDEAFLDVTRNKPGIALATDIAAEIRRAIASELHLTASAGVSYCKLLAKIASDYNKPDGMCVIHPDRALDFLATLEVEKFWGVGPHTAEQMHKMGIYTGLQLRQYSLYGLTQAFGKRGRIFFEYARGIDPSPVSSDSERKSVSCEMTFEKDIWKPSAVTIEIYHATLELVGRLRKQQFRGRTLTLKVKYADFRQVSRSITWRTALETKDQILPLAKQLFTKVTYDQSHPIRLIGLGVTRSADEDLKDELLRIEPELPFKEWT